MKKLLAIALCVVSFAAQAQMKLAYWWTAISVGDTKIEFDLNNVSQMTYAVKTSPVRYTFTGTQFMRTHTVNCVTSEVLRHGAWKKAAPVDLIICK